MANELNDKAENNLDDQSITGNSTQADKKIRELTIKFVINQNQIQTQMNMKNISAPEAIGLIETAKAQLLENLKKKTSNVFELSR